MVKLFVGNLSPDVKSSTLRELFSKHGTVAECDVIKNYAFVHVADQNDADQVIKNLDNFVLEGRPLHIEQSTSRLRKAPGMSSVCYRCGADDHKTPSCPIDNADLQRRMKHNGGKSSPNNGKRGPPRDLPYYHPVKREPMDNQGYAGGAGPPQNYGSAGYGPPRGPDPSSYYGQPQGGYMGGGPMQRPGGPGPGGYQQQGYPGMQQAAPVQQPAAPSIAEYYSTANAKNNDPVIPPPTDRDLDQLYTQYTESRDRYYYFRERIEKEMVARTSGRGPGPAGAGATTAPYSYGGGGGGGSMAGVGAYGTGVPQAQQQDPYGAAGGGNQSLVRYPDMYYNQQVQQGAAQPAGPAPTAAAYGMAGYSAPNGPPASSVYQQQAPTSAQSSYGMSMGYGSSMSQGRGPPPALF